VVLGATEGSGTGVDVTVAKAVAAVTEFGV
jgi:hypothetical protein